MLGLTAVSGAPIAALDVDGTQVASAPDSVATVPNGTVGVPTNIVVQARDEFGSNMTVGGSVVAITVAGANVAVPAVLDVGDGTYTASYTPVFAGNDTVTIVLGGVAISGSPYASVVAPAPVPSDALQSGTSLAIGLGI